MAASYMDFDQAPRDGATSRHVAVVLGDGVLNRCDPLGVRCIMGALEQVGHGVEALLEDRLMSRQQIARTISALRPSTVWVSVQPDTAGIGAFASQIAGSASTLVFGNVGARFLTRGDFAGFSDRVFVVLGQGEDAAMGLARYLEAPQSREMLEAVPNLRMFDPDQTFETRSEPSQTAARVVPSSKFLRAAIERGDIISARSSSGCNAHCTFCTVRAINNGQRWRATSTGALRAWLQHVLDADMVSGTINLIDDDLAGSLPNLESVATAFSEMNRVNGTALGFRFSTRAAHLVDPKDSSSERNRREGVWRFAVESGLESIFLGLESGSATQLRRHGKGCPIEVNYEGVSLAQRLGITLEIGFIPLDPFMEDISWRHEMRDNLRLARHCDVARSSPTWLAPARAYREAPLTKWLSNKNLLGPEIPETGEFEVRYQSHEVRQFISDLGPCLCVGQRNAVFAFKRELKQIQRYPVPSLREVARTGGSFVELELGLVEQLVGSRSAEDTSTAQISFIRAAVELLGRIENALRNDRSPQAVLIRRRAQEAGVELSQWGHVSEVELPLRNPSTRARRSRKVSQEQALCR